MSSVYRSTGVQEQYATILFKYNEELKIQPNPMHWWNISYFVEGFSTLNLGLPSLAGLSFPNNNLMDLLNLLTQVHIQR